MKWYEKAAPTPCRQSYAQAQAHQLDLTKPVGSLGRLELIAADFAAWQHDPQPQLDRISVRVFAADHGVCAQGVSAFPQAVTAQMIANFCAGGAAISVLCNDIGADFQVVNMGVIQRLTTMPKLVDYQLMPGTDDFSVGSAMSDTILEQALAAGAEQVGDDAQLCIGGEMGIGNTTSASAIFCALLNIDVAISVGPGTGVDAAGLARKCAVVERALVCHRGKLSVPLDILKRIGGLEIAALVGYYIAAAQRAIPSLVDGFISTAAALLAHGDHSRGSHRKTDHRLCGYR